MTVKEIVKEYLEENGYDGLCTDNCGCHKDDLFSCGEGCGVDCEPGHKQNCGDCSSKEQCGGPVNGCGLIDDGTFCIFKKTPEEVDLYRAEEGSNVENSKE